MPESIDNAYPPIFSDLKKFLPAVSKRFAANDPNLCASAVLVAIDQLSAKSIHQVASEMIAGEGAESDLPALIEIATSIAPDRDPNIMTDFRATLAGLDLAVSADEAWEILAKVGALRAREVLSSVVTGAIDPLKGAIEVSSVFYNYLQDEDRKRLCYANQPAPASRALCLQPFVDFYSVSDELYNAGYNVNAWNDTLPYATANTISAYEKNANFVQLRAKYLGLAEACLKNIA
jgi:hypothetical protein